jgi:hypothetical protein
VESRVAFLNLFFFVTTALSLKFSAVSAEEVGGGGAGVSEMMCFTSHTVFARRRAELHARASNVGVCKFTLLVIQLPTELIA